jgi:hypothetical protein
MDIIKGVIDKVPSRKLAVTAGAGGAAATGTIELAYGGGDGSLYRGADGGGYVGRVMN